MFFPRNIKKRSNDFNLNTAPIQETYKMPVFSSDLKVGLNDSQLKLIEHFENFNNKEINDIEYYKYSENNDNCLIYINQSHFKDGTLRITKPGVYKLQENIVFHPNPNNNFMPTRQQHLLNKYPCIGPAPYSLGFFCAIAIECDNVILDLNGFSIRQSREHFLEQRFYSNIEIASAPFIGPQGPGIPIGKINYKSGNNVLIMNGKLGLSSHHGIHSNYNKNIVLKNLEITDFQVAGIALNGVKNCVFDNINVHDSIKEISIGFEYSQARFIFPKLETIPNNYSINIQGKNKTIEEIKKNLDNEMKNTRTQFINGQPITSSIFANPNKNKQSDGNIYGIVFNVTGVVVNDFLKSRPETVFTTNLETRNEDIYLYNVSINNIFSTPNETVCIDIKGTIGLDGYSENNNLIRGPVGDVFNANKTSSGYISGNYISNPLADAQSILGKYKLENPNANVGTAYTSKDILAWIQTPSLDLKEIVDNDKPDLLSFVYGKDGMAHTMKGNIGLFLSGTKNLNGYNISINNIYLNGKNQIDIKSQNGKYAYGLLNTACKNIVMENFTVKNVLSEYGIEFSKKINNINI